MNKTVFFWVRQPLNYEVFLRKFAQKTSVSANFASTIKQARFDVSTVLHDSTELLNEG